MRQYRNYWYSPERNSILIRVVIESFARRDVMLCVSYEAIYRQRAGFIFRLQKDVRHNVCREPRAKDVRHWVLQTQGFPPGRDVRH